MIAALLFAQLALAQPYVVDADTVHDGKVKYRLAGVDAPEVDRKAACPAERQLGDRARIRVRELVDRAATVTVTAGGPEAKPAATEDGWPVDRYHRRLANIAIDGKDLGRLLVTEGLAVRWTGQKHDWCAR